MNNYYEMKKIALQFLVITIIFVSILACRKNEVLGEYKSIPLASWNRDSILLFQIPVADTMQNHNLYINVRNDINYKYSNLWLFINIIQPGDTTAVTDTFEVTLADPSGKWLGHGFGGVKTNELLFKQNVYFPVSGIYEIQVMQGMRGRQLEGITEIGYRLEKK